MATKKYYNYQRVIKEKIKEHLSKSEYFYICDYEIIDGRTDKEWCAKFQPCDGGWIVSEYRRIHRYNGVYDEEEYPPVEVKSIKEAMKIAYRYVSDEAIVISKLFN